MKKFEFKIDKEKMLNTVQEVGQKAQVAARKAGDKMKEGGQLIEEQYDLTKLEIDRKRLCPIFSLEAVLGVEYRPILVRIVDYDKRKENPACMGAKGFEEKIKQMRVLNIYREYADITDIEFYPYIKETIYCMNPYRKNQYICLDDYFDYLKKAKVDELETIAHKLGAKHVKITLKEKKSVLVNQNNKVKVNAGQEAVEIEHAESRDEFTNMEVAAEVDFDGNEIPSEPELIYFKGESDINALVKMRLDSESQNRIKAKTYRLNLSNSYAMQEKTAVQIDTVLKQFGCKGNATVESKVQSERRTILEYNIVFRD